MPDTLVYKDIKQLNPLAQVLLHLAIRDIKEQGINPLIVETYRSQQRQNYLYAQGRTRNLKSSRITWTLNSIHTLRNAVDLVPQRDGKAIWNSKDKETVELIKIMTQYGFEAGVNWSKNQDSAHFQIAGVSTVLKEYSAGNTNVYITKMIQKALNREYGSKLTEDGVWGNKTTDVINQWRRKKKYSQLTGRLEAAALNELLM